MRRRIILGLVAGALLGTSFTAGVPAVLADPSVSHGARGHDYRGHGESVHHASYPQHGRDPQAYGPHGHRPRYGWVPAGYYGGPPRRRYRRGGSSTGSNVLSGAIGAALMYGAYRVYNEKKQRDRHFDDSDVQDGGAPARKDDVLPQQKGDVVPNDEVRPERQDEGIEGNAELP
jgi:hypothetical protein